jgi:hypothetical protein
MRKNWVKWLDGVYSLRVVSLRVVREPTRMASELHGAVRFSSGGRLIFSKAGGQLEVDRRDDASGKGICG